MHLPHLRPHPHIPFFRIFYSTTFTVLSLVLGALLLVTPGDHIRESFNKGEIFHIFIVAGLYLLTLLISIFIYAGRLYATRSALARIPKEVNWAEEPGKAGREVRKGLARSTAIAYESHPRDLRDEKAERGVSKKRLGKTAEGRQSLDTISGLEPAWGVIAHPGWSSPCSPDLPNLHYEPVILELSHLIEAKAVSLAPSDPLLSSIPDTPLNEQNSEPEPPIPDPVAVELLQRPASMCLRDYLSHLSTLHMLDPDPLASDFLTRYEHARYSSQELDEGEFRALLGVFAEILRGMRPLDVHIVDEARAEMEEALSSDSDEDGYRDTESVHTTETVQRTPQPETYSTSTSSSSSSSSSSPRGSRTRSQSTLHTAPSRPAATRNPSSRSRRSAMTRPVHQRSLSSLRRMRTDTSSSAYSARSGAESVIRLKEATGPLDLPYAILTGDGEEV